MADPDHHCSSRVMQTSDTPQAPATALVQARFCRFRVGRRSVRDTPAHPPDNPALSPAHATAQARVRFRAPAGDPVIGSVAGRVDTGRQFRSLAWMVGWGSVLGDRVTLTCLLARPEAGGIPGAGPGRWPARPP